MIKLFNNVLDENKKIIYGISNLYGINKTQALLICNQLNISPKLKLKQLNQRVIYNISNYINNNLDIDKELKWKIKKNIDMKIKANIYEGIRHRLSLPLNGQRTHSNAKSFKRTKGYIKPKKTKRK